jgi:hypothetical protein
MPGLQRLDAARVNERERCRVCLAAATPPNRQSRSRRVIRTADSSSRPRSPLHARRHAAGARVVESRSAVSSLPQSILLQSSALLQSPRANGMQPVSTGVAQRSTRHSSDSHSLRYTRAGAELHWLYRVRVSGRAAYMSARFVRVSQSVSARISSNTAEHSANRYRGSHCQ